MNRSEDAELRKQLREAAERIKALEREAEEKIKAAEREAERAKQDTEERIKAAEREAERAKRETEKVQRETEERIKAAERETERAKREAKERIKAVEEEAARDKAALIAGFEEERAENARFVTDQTLDNYLTGIHRVTFYMQRLVPLPRTTSIPQTLSENSSSPATTSGRTSIVGKFYPQKLRVWSDFDTVCRAAYGRVAAALGAQPLFPSVSSIEHVSGELHEVLMEEVVGSEAFMNEAKTSHFLHETLQKPTQRILNAYLQVTGSPKKLYFDNLVPGWRPPPSDTENTPEGADVPRRPPKTQPDCHVLCADILPSTAQLQATAETKETEETEHARLDEQPGDDVAKVPASTIRHVHRISIAEHKAVHRLRAAVVKDYANAIDEGFVVQLAQIARSVKVKPAPAAAVAAAAAATAAATATATATADDPPGTDAIATAQEDAVRQTKRGPPGQVFFVRALIQAFHYMVSAGIEYGYVANGETLTFLCVSRDDPATLYYHTALFPAYTRLQISADGQSLANPFARLHPGTSTETPDDSSQLAVCMLTGLCLLAYESHPEPARQRSINLSLISRFPDLPDDTTASQRTSRQSSRKRQNDDDDDDDDDDNNDNNDDDNDDDDNNNGDNDDNGSDQGRMRGRLQVPAHRPRRPSPLKRVRSANSNNDNYDDDNNNDTDNDNDSAVGDIFGHKRPRKRKRIGRQYDNIVRPTLPSRLDPSTFRPIRPYCSQACLLSLMRGGGLDAACPNVVLHRRALQRDGTDLRTRPTAHAITAAELPELVRLQLLANAEQDCHCFLEQGLRGAIGCLFKITLTGYGYTFSAKGVDEYYSGRLRHEMRVYSALSALQGSAVPVCLGLAELLLPWPMANGVLVTHMLLMSYGGRSLYRLGDRAMQALRRRIDVEDEIQRTERELAQAGFVDFDTESNGNLTWCPERQRVMKIDFDNAQVRPQLAVAAVAAATATTATTASTASVTPTPTQTAPHPAAGTVYQDDNWLHMRHRPLPDDKVSFVESMLLC